MTGLRGHPRPDSRRGLILLMLVAMTVLVSIAGSPSGASAHANLQSTDPPVDGLLVSSPSSIRMRFTEEVASSPEPTIRLLDQSGNPVPEADLRITIDPDDPKAIIVDVPDLDRGTWTVAWTVTSATDGHTLSGTWAFRIGGGLPPGQATSEDSSPAVWAVALRWMTFLGVATAAGVLLFPFLLRRDDGAFPTDRFPLFVAWLGTAEALLATLLEPVCAWLADRSLSLADHIDALPDAWNWRPLTLFPLVVGLSVLLVMQRPAGRAVSISGAFLALASLLGLILTSHAAGRDDDRWLAILSDAVHQWSVALWAGGLLALVVWLVRSGRPDNQPVSLRLGMFSTIALGLFVVGVVTGVANTTIMLDLVQRVREDGFGVAAFSDLWTSRYGVVVLIKVAVLVGPFLLAVYHRNVVGRLIHDSGQWVTTIPARMRSTIRWEYLLVALVVLGGSTLAMSSPPVQTESSTLAAITLVAPTDPVPSDDSLLVHLTVDPAAVGDNQLTLQLTTWAGDALPADPAPRVTLSFTSIDHGTHEGGVPLSEGADGWVTSGLKLSLDGWWRVTATIQRPGMQNATADFMLLLPDPNTQGMDAPPQRTTDHEAEAIFQRAMNQMTSWTSVRWTELIGSGLDVLVVGDFAVVEPGNGEPNAYSMDLLFSGSFAQTAAGADPTPPSFGGRRSVVVGDRGWLSTTSGQWLEEAPTRFVPPSGWDETYTGATDFQLGAEQTVDGVDYTIVTFHLPEQTTSAEAWFVWWIDPTSGDVVQINMISRMHYMTWLYRDINGDVVIAPPVGDGTSATPAATPAG